MSLDRARQQLRCDTPDCESVTPLPISISSSPVEAAYHHLAASSASGWLFVANPYEERHYCPQCSSRVIGNPTA
ncbi:MAG: hypothetical protein M1330_02020 [Armatimonadetes bacterium]|nr:hypothetical protein [Armatimonadota bacterium]